MFGANSIRLRVELIDVFGCCSRRRRQGVSSHRSELQRLLLPCGGHRLVLKGEVVVDGTSVVTQGLVRRLGESAAPVEEKSVL